MFREKGRRYPRAVRPFSFMDSVMTMKLGAILSVNSFANVLFDVRRLK